MNRIVAVGASAGGVGALEKLVSGLPADFPAALIIVLHVPADRKSLLPGILGRLGTIAAQEAADDAEMQPGHAYVARPDHHVLVEQRTLKVRRGPRENGFRPSVDVLFRSAALSWSARAIGVVLSGALDDGASGLWAIKYMGGLAIVQDPKDATYDSMPVHALRRADVDHIVPAAGIGPLLDRLVRAPAPEEPAHAEEFRAELKREVDISSGDSPGRATMSLKPSPYTCPECHGVMFELPQGGERRFRCHTGHGYALGALLSSTLASSENTLWSAVRSVQEGIALLHEAADDLERRGSREDAAGLRERARHASAQLDALRKLSARKGNLSR